VLDAPHEAWAEAHLGYVFRADASHSDWDRVGFVEAGARGMLLYAENDHGTDIEVQVCADEVILQGFNGGWSFYGLTAIRLPIMVSQRFVGGYGLRVEAAPGLYAGGTSIGSGAWQVPFGVTGIYAPDAAWAVFAGLVIRPGYAHPVEPRLGVRWAPSGVVRVDLGYPETLARVQVLERLRLGVGAEVRRGDEFSMGDDERRRIRLREGRVFARGEWEWNATSRLTVDVGRTFWRRLDFAREAPGVRLSPALGFRLGWAWLF
jgi:hypothetical protein